MKASAQSLGETPGLDRAWVGILCELLKARLTFLVLVTTLVGFYLGSSGELDYWRLIHTILGTALVAGGASALNQYLERDLDAKMRRTRTRPLPAGQLQPETVLWFGVSISLLGLVYLCWAVNGLTGALGAATLATYLFVYTPLKRVTSLNTAIGAIPGALPPLMGWTAARGVLTTEGWALFAILYCWQLPHFLAIAWIYRDEYAQAGYVMLPVVDVRGRRTACSAISHTLGLLPLSLSPVVFGMAGRVYLAGALVLGAVFLWLAVQFGRSLTVARARQLFFWSIIYLPLLLGLMVFDKIKS